MALLDESGDHLDLLGNVLHRARFDVRFEQVQFCRVGMKFCGPAGGELGKRLALFLGLADRLVIYVRDIADVANLETGRFDDAAKHVLHHEGSEIPDVSGTVHGRSAAVQPEGIRFQRGNGTKLAG